MKPSCKEIQDLIIERTSGVPPSQGDEEKIRKHLNQCPACRRFREDISRILHDLDATSRPAVPETLFREIRQGVLQSLEDALPAPTRMWERIRQRFRGVLTTRPLLLPAMTGGMGVLVGIVVTLTWLRPPVLPESHRITPNQPALTAAASPAPTALSSAAEELSTGDIETYVGTDSLFDTLENQDIQSLLTQWSEEIPDGVMDLEDSGTG